ncbi:MAG: hypothetical protein A3K23_06490 [Desulfobacca sp. RBG_16_58_9]|nr:MAG: hypothetical protein A3K23_06490 [Desulfobacca sp. RBG_16_58_9]
MDKLKFNFIIDATMFLCLMAMASLGFLMKYSLPPGREVQAKYGRNLQLTWLGWDRHDWGDIHLYLAFALLTLLVVHLILHWHQILGLFQRVVPDPRRRHRIALIFLLLSLLLIYFPFLITPDTQARGRGGQRSQVGGPAGAFNQNDPTEITLPLRLRSYGKSPLQAAVSGKVFALEDAGYP